MLATLIFMSAILVTLWLFRLIVATLMVMLIDTGHLGGYVNWY